MNSPNSQPIILNYPANLRQRWPRPLADEWALTYPQIFDEDDLRQTVLQTRTHFYEWFVAIHLFESQGALSLIEKYGYRAHPRKVTFLDSFLSAEQCAFLRSFRTRFGVQPPDLFVYMPGTNRFWFAEVKGGRDRLRPLQRDSHVALAETLGTHVQMFYVRPG